MSGNSSRGHTGGRAERGHWPGRAPRGRVANGRGRGRGRGRGNKSTTPFERSAHHEAGVPEQQQHQEALHLDQHLSQSGSLQYPPPLNPLTASVNYAVQSVLAPSASPFQHQNQSQQTHQYQYQHKHQPQDQYQRQYQLPHHHQHSHQPQPQSVLRNVQNSIQNTTKPIISHPTNLSTNINTFTQFHPQLQSYPHPNYHPFAQTQHQFPPFNPPTRTQYFRAPSIPFPPQQQTQLAPFMSPIHSPIQQPSLIAAAGPHYYPQQHWGLSSPASTLAQQPCPLPTRLTAEGYSISSTAPSRLPECSQNNLKRTKFDHDQGSREHHRCGQCNQDFQSLTNLSMHLAQHLKCDYEDCTFEGLPKVLEIHQEDRHLIFKPGRGPTSATKKLDGPPNATISGLGYALKTQEQISKWIQDRKRRWPTAKVIAEKLAKAEASANRKGNQSNPNRAQNGCHTSHTGDLNRTGELKSAVKRKMSVSGPSPTAASTVTTVTLAKPTEDLANASSLGKANAAGGGCVNADDERSSMSGWGAEELDKLVAASETSGSVNEDMDPVRDAVSSKCPTAGEDPVDAAHTSEPRSDPAAAADAPGERRTVVCRWWKMGRCKKGDSCRFAHPPKDPSAEKTKKSVKPPKKSTTIPADFARPGLLSKLIEKDVEQEVSDLLAVSKFLVQNGFLDDVEHQIGDAEEHERRVVEVEEEKQGGSSDGLDKDDRDVAMQPQSEIVWSSLGIEAKAMDLGVCGPPHPIGADGGAENLTNTRLGDYSQHTAVAPELSADVDPMAQDHSPCVGIAGETENMVRLVSHNQVLRSEVSADLLNVVGPVPQHQSQDIGVVSALENVA